MQSQSPSLVPGRSSVGSSAPSGSMVQVCFPSVQTSVLESLNKQREEGQFCDLAIQVQGQVFKAHRCVLAASSPYFHDQVLLKNMSTVSIPAVMDPLAFESVLSCAYTGQLRMLREDIVNYLTVGSVLQMWHIVDKCTELLKEGRAAGSGALLGQAGGGEGLRNPGCSSSAASGGGGGGSAEVQRGGSDPQPVPPQTSRPSLSESQSPSSTNYFSPREASFGGGPAVVEAPGEGGGSTSTPSYCDPSGGESFLIEEEEEDEGEEEELVYTRKRERRSGRRKRAREVSGLEVGVSDSFGVSSYQDGDSSPSLKRPAYSQPSIMPRKQWVVVKTEQAQDDDLIVVSGEEGAEEEDDDEEERELEMMRERERTFNISNIRTLAGDQASRADTGMDAQMDYCHSSEDYLKFDSGLLDQTQSHNLQDSSSTIGGRSVSTLLGQVQSAATRAQLYPLDMQGNQILLYSQAALETAPPLGLGAGVVQSYKGPNLEHGAVHLSAHGGSVGGVDGMEGGAGGGVSGKVFMCHCGKTFTHKSMRDRHINMHLDLRPFHCPVCAKKFKMKHHLTEHMKTHTGLKPYNCHSCGKKFMWRDSFMRHRSHCERRGAGRGGGGGGGGGGEEREGGGEGSDGGEVMSPPRPSHPHLPAGEAGQGIVGSRAGSSLLSSHHLSMSAGGGVGNAMSCLGLPGAGTILGAGSQSSSMFGVGAGRGGCEEEVCKVRANDDNIT